MDILNPFLCKVLSSVGRITSDVLQGLVLSYKSALGAIGIREEYKEYVVCSKYSSLYSYDGCLETRAAGQQWSKCCRFVEFPKHRYQQYRSACGELLLKKSQLVGENVKLIPRKSYPYYSLKRSLASLISRPGFIEQCEHWRERAQNVPTGILGDVYDGRVWKQFCTEQNKFLQYPGNFLLLMNMDFFQPFTHTTYSVGVIYCVILNLPREIRYKFENMIVISVIPGPQEPKLNINTYLKPLVEELQELYKGVVLPCSDGITTQRHIRACVACFAANIPASCKVCGFLGHNARLGCNKCYKELEFHI